MNAGPRHLRCALGLAIALPLATPAPALPLAESGQAADAIYVERVVLARKVKRGCEARVKPGARFRESSQARSPSRPTTAWP